MDHTMQPQHEIIPRIYLSLCVLPYYTTLPKLLPKLLPPRNNHCHFCNIGKKELLGTFLRVKLLQIHLEQKNQHIYLLFIEH